MKMLLVLCALMISTLTFAQVISEDKAISIHAHACSAQAGLSKMAFDKNIQVDFDDVFMEYNFSSSVILENGTAMVCKSTVAENGKIGGVDLAKLPTL